MGATVLRNRYRVVESLGGGGGGSVYAVEDLCSSGGRLALKALSVDDGDQSLVDVLRQEFRVLASLRHPMLARVHDFGRLPADSGLDSAAGRCGYFLTRDLIEGVDLLSSCRGLTPAAIAGLFVEIAHLLDVLHRAGMVHGDFKPANVIVDGAGRPHLIDFGLTSGEGRRRAGGTAAYLPPEVIRGLHVDRRADLYSFGISLYHLLVGHPPVSGDNPAEAIDWHLHGEPLALDDQAFALAGLERVLHRLTARDPDGRYPSAAEAALALEEVLSAAGVEQEVREEIFVPPPPQASFSGPLQRLEGIAQQRTGCAVDPAQPQGDAGEAPDGQRGERRALVVVSGDPGAGKTTLLRELAWRLQLRGVEVLRAESNVGDPRAYGLLSDLLDQVAGLTGQPHPLARSGQAASDDRYAVYQRIADYLTGAARRFPLMLLVEHVGEGDEESRAALRYLGHALEPELPLLIVAALDRKPGAVEALGDPLELVLPELDRLEVRALYRQLSGRADDELADELATYTGGNRQFVLEVLRRLWSSGWPPSPDLRRLAPPRRVEEVYRARWGELDEGQRRILALLALFGRPMAEAALAKLCGPATTAPMTEALEASGWLQRRAGGMWGFRQGVAARLVRGLTDGETARSLHERVVEHLETCGQPELSEVVRHALGAGRVDRALSVLPAALSRLREIAAHRRALELCEAARERLAARGAPGDERRVDELRCEGGELCRLLGDYRRAAELLSAVREEHEPLWLRAQLELATLHRAAGEVQRALELLRGLEQRGLSPELELRVAIERVAALTMIDEHDEVLEAVGEALVLAERGDGGAARAELLGRKAWSLGYQQRYREATTAFEQALGAARELGDRRVELDIHNRWAVIAFRQGDYEGVARRYAEALAAAREIGHVERSAVILFNLGAYHLQRGEFAAGLQNTEQSLRLFEAMGARQSSASARCNLGQLQLAVGLLQQARDNLDRARRELDQLGLPSGRALAEQLSGLVRAQQQRFSEARALIEGARATFVELGRRRDAVDALLDLADVELRAGEASAAGAALRRAEQGLDLEQLSDLQVRAHALFARVAALVGDEARRVEAAERLERAFTMAGKLDALQPRWECHLAAMELATARGQPSRATKHARVAVEILERMVQDLTPEVQTAFWSEPRRRAARARAQHHQMTRDSMRQQRAPVGGSEPVLAPGSEPTLPPGALPRTSGASEERFYRLLEIYRRINSELDPERLLGVVMDTAVELTGAQRGFLLLGERGGELEVVVARNIDPEQQAGAYSRSIAERVFSTAQPIVTVSAHNDPRFADYASVHQLQLESVLCIPVHARDRICGVLYMESRFQSGRFTPDDQRLLMAFGDQVAIALTNAQLYADNVAKARELEQAKREIEQLADERGRLLAERTEQLHQAERDLAATRRQIATHDTGRHGLVGRSAPMLELFDMIDRVAVTDVPVLIEGESGTGKEMVARAIHQRSERARRRLVSVNCAAIPENLLESELFGHVRGAFTGADRERKGLFSIADGGSLFLDEIGDMPPRMQVDLLRALQEKTIRPVGGQKDIQVDVRVLAASNKPLKQLVRQRVFREDLFYRLHVIRLELPPLRERTEDIPLLVDHFLERIAAQMKTDQAQLTREAMRHLVSYSWPGNVRQLEHALMNAAILADGDVLGPNDFNLESPREGATVEEPPSAQRPATAEERHEAERRRILAALEHHDWNKSKAAAALGIPRRTFYRRLRSHGIQ